MEYTGTCYIGIVGSEEENGETRDSIENMQRRHGDSPLSYVRATKGYEARQMHINNFIGSSYDFLLLLDADMVFERDTLEKLRAWKMPYLSGFYMRRRYNPIAPVWYQYEEPQKFPMKLFLERPERGRLHPLGASGWGCILIHRQVILETRKVLKGENDVLEDDLDLWPYDILTIVQSLKHLHNAAVERKDWDLVATQVRRLEGELQILRGTKDPVGSDIRYPFYARQAGFVLYGDPDVRPGHMLNYPLSPNDFDGQPEDVNKKLQEYYEGEARKMREEGDKYRLWLQEGE